MIDELRQYFSEAILYSDNIEERKLALKMIEYVNKQKGFFITKDILFCLVRGYTKATKGTKSVPSMDNVALANYITKELGLGN